tara:strand:+ start:78 stop:800 length:723 start_codon:yes stop_codon:yes gene_type:complete
MNRSVFIGVRSGSTRAINKNVRPFLKDGTSILQNRLLQLMDVDCDEIIVSTNCDICIEQASLIALHDSRIKIVERPSNLCLDTTLVTDLMNHIVKHVNSSTIMWTHVTSPFISSKDMNKAFDIYEDKNSFDSVLSVNPIQNFVWDQNSKNIINNYNLKNKWPNTQDLYPLHEINHAFYICSKETLANGDRVGKNPNLYECHGESGIDIDWERDFKFAQKVALISENTMSLTEFYKKKPSS